MALEDPSRACPVVQNEGTVGSGTRLERALGFLAVPAGAPQSFRTASTATSSQGK